MHFFRQRVGLQSSVKIQTIWESYNSHTNWRRTKKTKVCSIQNWEVVFALFFSDVWTKFNLLNWKLPKQFVFCWSIGNFEPLVHKELSICISHTMVFVERDPRSVCNKGSHTKRDGTDPHKGSHTRQGCGLVGSLIPCYKHHTPPEGFHSPHLPRDQYYLPPSCLF